MLQQDGRQMLGYSGYLADDDCIGLFWVIGVEALCETTWCDRPCYMKHNISHSLLDQKLRLHFRSIIGKHGTHSGFGVGAQAQAQYQKARC